MRGIFYLSHFIDIDAQINFLSIIFAEIWDIQVG